MITNWPTLFVLVVMVSMSLAILHSSFNKPELVVVPELELAATIHSCEFLDYTQWKSEYVRNVYWSLMNDKYPVRSEFINDFSATDSDLLPLAECLWEWYIKVWRWNGTN